MIIKYIKLLRKVGTQRISNIDLEHFESIWQSFERCDKYRADDQRRNQNRPM